MNPVILKAVVGSATVLFLVACGGAAPPAEDSSKAKTPSAAPTAEKSPAAGEKVSPEELHRRFIDGCAKTAPNANDFCECAWGQSKGSVSEDNEMTPEKMQELRSKVAAACASKLPEDTLKNGYVQGCAGEVTDAVPYCECTWTQFRKRFSAQELTDDQVVKTERFASSREPVVKACSSKMPEKTAKESFMKGCAKDSTAANAFCACAWKEMRKQAGPAEVIAGLFDEKKTMGQVDAACGKLRPAK